MDWLEYTHWRRSSTESKGWERADVMDDYACNRGESRVLNNVDDLLLVARITATGAGTFCFRGRFAGREYVVELEPHRGSGRLVCDGEVIRGSEFGGGEGAESGALLVDGATVEFSLIDHQVLLAIDGRLVVNHVCAEADGPRPDSVGSPLAIGAAGLAVDVTELRLYRDVYYIPPARSGAITLDQNEYYVVGDNSPLSADSRTGWPGPGLPSRYILGLLGVR
jgi:signal peptidase I